MNKRYHVFPLLTLLVISRFQGQFVLCSFPTDHLLPAQKAQVSKTSTDALGCLCHISCIHTMSAEWEKQENLNYFKINSKIAW